MTSVDQVPPMHGLIHHYLYLHARQRGPQTALVCAGHELSYGELAARAAALAHWLQQQGVRPGDRVGIYLPKGVEPVIALYGILAAGAVYVPLDPAAPPARTAFAIADCGIRGVIGQGTGAEALAAVLAAGAALNRDLNWQLDWALGAEPGSIAALETVPWSALDALPVSPPAPTRIEDDLAYIIYTSGSTGQPKGIMHSHRSGLAFARWAVACYRITPQDRLTNQAPLHFDMSIFDLFGALVAGAAAVIVPDVVMRLPAAYAELLETQRASLLFTVPFVLSQLLLRGALPRRDLSRLRWIVFGGDNHAPGHIRQLMQALPATRFSHMYGPAETNGCTYVHLDGPPADPEQPIPIGRGCEGMVVELMDEAGEPVAQGCQSGELWVRGATLMQGYWNRPDLSRRALVTREPADGPAQRWCRTGDLAERLADGQFRFLGRRDRQVKLRGFRIELEEIESALLACLGVEEAAAFAVGDHDSGQRVAACVTVGPGGPGATPADGELRAQLQRQLPRYALPERIEVVARLPRTPSGKVDRLALGAAWGEPVDG